MFALTFNSLLHSPVYLTSEPLIEGSTMTISEVDDLKNETHLQNLIQTKQIKTIVLEGTSISTIPTFECFKSVEEFTLNAENVDTIPKYLFSRSNSLKTVNLSPFVSTIDDYAFFMSTIQTINLENVENLNRFAFYRCTNLISVNLANCFMIGAYAFGYCSNLTTIEIIGFAEKEPNSFYGIGINSFEYNYLSAFGPADLVDSSLETLTIGQIRFDHFNLEVPLKNLKTVIFQAIPNRVVISNQPNLREIQFPQSDELITASCYFNSNPKLRTIDTSKLERFISFIGCMSLESLDVSHATSFSSNVFERCSSLRELIGFSSNNNLEIFPFAFRYCFNLKFTSFDGSKISFLYNKGLCSSGIEEVQFASFSEQPDMFDMPLLRKVEFLESCTFTSIRSQSFADCPSLQEIIINTKITVISSYSFYNLNLTKFDLKNVEQISIYAFCKSGIRELIIAKDFTITNPVWSEEQHNTEFPYQLLEDVQLILYKEPNLEKITLKQDVTKTYLMNIYSLHSFTYDVSENPIYTIENNVMYSNNKKIIEAVMDTTISSYHVPQSVCFIRPYAFSPSTNLEEITVDSNIKSFESVFANCFKLKTVKINSPITALHSKMFINCTELTTIIVTQPITKIYDSCFYGCRKLTLTFQNSLEEIGAYSFKNCKSITNINLQKVKFIPRYCFSGCESIVLENVNSLIEIDQYAFYDSGIKSFNCPSTLKHISKHSFKSCTKLQSFIIGTGLKEILEGVFHNTSLESIEIPANILNIDPHAFDYSMKIKFTFPAEGHPLFECKENFFYNKKTKKLIFTYGSVNKGPLVIPKEVEVMSSDNIVLNRISDGSRTVLQSFSSMIVHENVLAEYTTSFAWRDAFIDTCFLGIRKITVFATYRDIADYPTPPKYCNTDNLYSTLKYETVDGNYPLHFIFDDSQYNKSHTIDYGLFNNEPKVVIEMQYAMNNWFEITYNNVVEVVLIITVSIMLIVIFALFIIINRY